MFGRKFLLLRKKIISLKDSVLDDDKSEFPSMKNECVTSLDSGFVSSRKRLKSNLKISLKHTTELCSLENENGAHMSTRGDSQDLSLLFGLESQQKSILFEREADEETHTENFTLSKFKEILNQNNRNINKLIDEIKFKEEGDLRKFLNRKLFQVYYNERFFIYSNVSTRYHRIKYINITNKVCNSNTSFISQYKSLSWKIQREIELTLFPVDFISLQLLKSRMNEKEIQSQIEKIQHELEYKNSLREEFQQRKNDLLTVMNIGESHRRKIHEYIHSIKGNIRVYCRVKPSLEENTVKYPELLDNPKFDKTNLSSLELKNLKTNEGFSFNFDRIFHEESTQEEIFLEVKQFIQSALDGDNVCIFAYGSTGSGKTHTMQGSYSNGLINKDSGILPRCAEFIFEETRRLSLLDQNISIHLSAYEIYNENLFDLIGPTKKNAPRQPLNIGMVGNDVQIKNLTYIRILNKEDIIKFTKEASDSRRSDSTQFNNSSSRSHAIFQIKIDMTSSKNEMRTSVINIVDLAGSERSSLTSFGNKTKDEIELAKRIQTEANFINKSLTTLGRVISLIGDKKSSKVAVPYRESKLTMVLQNYLKANSKTVMIVTVCSDTNSFNLAKESLKFATNAMISC